MIILLYWRIHEYAFHSEFRSPYISDIDDLEFVLRALQEYDSVFYMGLRLFEIMYTISSMNKYKFIRFI